MIKILTSIKQINRKKWTRLVEQSNPFYDYDWFLCLEESGCVGGNSGWIPIFFIEEDTTHILAAVSGYIKLHSYGEFVFDFQWANAYHNAGIDYYPKLILASAFTPATGKRVLLDSQKETEYVDRLLNAVIMFAEQERLSSIHCLFAEDADHNSFKKHGFMKRISVQYQFQNQSFDTFETYLAGLKSNRRKTIRQERRKIQKQELDIHYLTGNQISELHLETMWQFYQSTHQKKGHYGYLNKDFFMRLYSSMTKRLLLVYVKEGQQYIAGSMSLFKNNVLYGRYWGAIIPKQFLHFECCIYQLIEWTIAHNISVFDAGVQGEHKFRRGFHPVLSTSLHYICRDDGRKMVQEFLNVETPLVRKQLEQYKKMSVIKTL